MKTLRCAKCEKDVLVEDNYQLLTCPICLAKRKASYAVESAERDFEKEAEKQLKALFGDNPPEHLSYGKMKEFYETHFHRELTWEQYIKNIQDVAVHKIQFDADSQVQVIKGEKAERIKYNARFLNFDLYPPSNRNECKKFRHMAMGSYTQDVRFMEEHVLECPECRLWQDAKDNGTLNAEYTTEIWHSDDTENEIKEPTTFEEKIDSMHDVSEGLGQAINNEYDRRPQPTEPHDPLQEELQRDYDEGKAETERINQLSPNKLKKWLNEPDSE
ncbi:MAG TPA: hypothetical protein VI864_06790 [Candidatus Bathyarchaeia archaeon]|nr:hypothetical protein [Candidatus Bathyarchaeia archaeon]